MIQIKQCGAQGDVLFVRVSTIPAGCKRRVPQGGEHVLAHSETGHHHVVRADGVVVFDPSSGMEMTCYLQVDGFADIVHKRPFDTHETVRLGAGSWLVRRQREYTPQGFRRVVD